VQNFNFLAPLVTEISGGVPK